MRCVCAYKMDEEGLVENAKTGLVAKEFSQAQDVEYF